MLATGKFKMNLAFLYWCCCFVITVTAVRDNRTYAEAMEDLLKTVPIAPLPKCVTMLAQLYGPNKKAPREALGDYLGHGYDPLTETTRLSVFDDSYENCNVTVDNKFIVPDFYKTELLMEGNRDKITKVYSTMKEFTSSSGTDTGAKGSGSTSGLDIGGGFSTSSKETKTNMERKDMSLILMATWYKKYRIEADISTSFNRVFHERVLDVVNKQKEGLNRMAHYLVEDIYNDYGMHIIRGAILGVRLERKVYVSSSLLQASSEKTKDLKAEIAGTMSKKINLNGGASGGKTESSSSKNEVSQIDRIDYVHVLGGPDYSALASDNYEDLVKDTNVAALSHETIPIYKMIHTGTFNQLANNSEALKMVRDLFQDVYNEILLRNTYYGCTYKEYHNFDVQANVDDGSCDGNKCKEYPGPFKCEKNGKNETVDKAFFEDLNIGDYQKCVESQKVVEKNGEYFRKRCNREKPREWNRKPNFAAFYQTCALSDLSKNFDEELESLNQNRSSRCDSLTDSFPRKPKKLRKCPKDTEESTLPIKSYNHQLRDYSKHVECDDNKVSINLKDTATIKTYWCQPKDNKGIGGLYYGGSFQRGQVNSYTRMEGCDYDMEEVKIFHDTVICVNNKRPEGSEKEIFEIPVLTRIFRSNGDNTTCGSKQSKELLTIIGGEKMYACVLKKKGYNDAPLPKPLQLPFNDYLDMYETDSQSVIKINEKKIVLRMNRLAKEYLKVCPVKKLEPDEEEDEVLTSLSPNMTQEILNTTEVSVPSKWNLKAQRIKPKTTALYPQSLSQLSLTFY